MSRFDQLKMHPAFRTWSKLPQMVLQQAAWWACVLWMGWLGPVAMLAFLLLHLWMLRNQWRTEVGMIVLATVLGIALDNALGALGAVTYVGTLRIGWAPIWLVAIWAGFGATLGHSQAIFVRSLRNALLIGLLGGPLAYMGGEKLDRLTISGPTGFLWISLLWGIVLVVLYWAARPKPANDSA
jgi:hypothetical protein